MLGRILPATMSGNFFATFRFMRLTMILVLAVFSVSAVLAPASYAAEKKPAAKSAAKKQAPAKKTKSEPKAEPKPKQPEPVALTPEQELAKKWEELFSRGLIRFNEKNYTEALGFFNDAIAADPNRIRSHYYLGMTYYNMKNYAAAVEPFTRAHELDPESMDIDYALANTYIELKLWQDAQTLADGIYAKAKKPAELQQALNFRAFIEFRKDNLDGAEEMFAKSLEINKNSDQGKAAQNGLERIDATQKQRKKYAVVAQLKEEYDTNVILLPDGQPLPSQISGKGDYKTTANLNATLMPYKTPSSTASVGYLFTGTRLMKLTNFNTMTHGANAAYSHNLDSYMYTVMANYSYTLVADKKYLQSYTGGMTFMKPSSLGITSLAVTYTPKTFAAKPADSKLDRDGATTSITLGHTKPMFENAGFAMLNGNFALNGTKGTEYDYKTYALTGILRMPLAAGISLDMNADITMDKYDNVSMFSPSGTSVRRSDTKYSASVALSREIYKWFGFTLGYEFSRSDSNIISYRYNRHDISAMISATF